MDKNEVRPGELVRQLVTVRFRQRPEIVEGSLVYVRKVDRDRAGNVRLLVVASVNNTGRGYKLWGYEFERVERVENAEH